MKPLFKDRRDAGRALAKALAGYADRPDVVVLGLPRGGVAVAAEVAEALHAPLDVCVARKLGVPGHEELAMGAISTGGAIVLNEQTLRQLEIGRDALEVVRAREAREVERQERLYRDGRPPIDLCGKTAVLIDDGLATGSTMRAAVAAVRRARPARVVVGVPVGASETCALLRDEADEVVCAATPEPFLGVGMWYEDFGQTTDDEVQRLLGHAQCRRSAAAG